MIAQIYSPDYESKSASKMFKVSPVPVIVSSPTYTNNNSLTSSSHVTNNGNNNNNNTSSAAHINTSKNKNRHQHTSPINPVNNGNNNNSLAPSPNTPGSDTKKSNHAASNAAQINNSKNNNLHNPFSWSVYLVHAALFLILSVPTFYHHYCQCPALSQAFFDRAGPQLWCDPYPYYPHRNGR